MAIAGRASLQLALLGILVLQAGCPNGAGITCPTGQTFCGGKCIYVASDPANCGGCGTVCPGALACIDGSCGCPTGLSNCANVCVDENVDGNNCGSCGAVCVAGFVCSSGTCEVTCGPNLQQCSNSCIDTQNDPHNCGMCQHACGPFEICCGGMCVGTGTNAHCGSCAPCMPGSFCGSTGTDMGMTCIAG